MWPWDDFQQMRKAAQRLRHDPSPLVRANAWHVEEDTCELLALESLRERLAEQDEAVAAAIHQPQLRGKGRRAARKRCRVDRHDS